jgi:hypothetical protein
VAGSRRRQRAESAETTSPEVTDHDTGAEAWDEEVVQADDVITETEAGPLEESDLDDGADGADGADGLTSDDDVITETEAGPLDESDLDSEADGAEDEVVAEDDSDDGVVAEAEEDTDGDPAEEKGN